MKATDGYTIKMLESVTSSDKPGVQIVYKVFGNVNGDISGDNITVLLMGDGSVNGDIKLDHGEVVLIKGNVNGDVKAETLVCPEKPKAEKEETPTEKIQASRLATQNISSPQIVHYDEMMDRHSCKSCINYHPTDSEEYEMYCEYFHRFYYSANFTCSSGYKRRDQL